MNVPGLTARQVAEQVIATCASFPRSHETSEDACAISLLVQFNQWVQTRRDPNLRAFLDEAFPSAFSGGGRGASSIVQKFANQWQVNQAVATKTLLDFFENWTVCQDPILVVARTDAERPWLGGVGTDDKNKGEQFVPSHELEKYTKNLCRWMLDQGLFDYRRGVGSHARNFAKQLVAFAQEVYVNPNAIVESKWSVEVSTAPPTASRAQRERGEWEPACQVAERTIDGRDFAEVQLHSAVYCNSPEPVTVPSNRVRDRPEETYKLMEVVARAPDQSRGIYVPQYMALQVIEQEHVVAAMARIQRRSFAQQVKANKQKRRHAGELESATMKRARRPGHEMDGLSDDEGGEPHSSQRPTRRKFSVAELDTALEILDEAKWKRGRRNISNATQKLWRDMETVLEIMKMHNLAITPAISRAKADAHIKVNVGRLGKHVRGLVEDGVVREVPKFSRTKSEHHHNSDHHDGNPEHHHHDHDHHHHHDPEQHHGVDHHHVVAAHHVNGGDHHIGESDEHHHHHGGGGIPALPVSSSSSSDAQGASSSSSSSSSTGSGRRSFVPGELDNALEIIDEARYKRGRRLRSLTRKLWRDMETVVELMKASGLSISPAIRKAKTEHGLKGNAGRLSKYLRALLLEQQLCTGADDKAGASGSLLHSEEFYACCEAHIEALDSTSDMISVSDFAKWVNEELLPQYFAPHRVESRAKARAARAGVKDPMEVQRMVSAALENRMTAMQERRISARTAREWLLKLGMQFDKVAQMWLKPGNRNNAGGKGARGGGRGARGPRGIRRAGEEAEPSGRSGRRSFSVAELDNALALIDEARFKRGRGDHITRGTRKLWREMETVVEIMKANNVSITPAISKAKLKVNVGRLGKFVRTLLEQGVCQEVPKSARGRPKATANPDGGSSSLQMMSETDVAPPARSRSRPRKKGRRAFSAAELDSALDMIDEAKWKRGRRTVRASTQKLWRDMEAVIELMKATSLSITPAIARAKAELGLKGNAGRLSKSLRTLLLDHQLCTGTESGSAKGSLLHSEEFFMCCESYVDALAHANASISAANFSKWVNEDLLPQYFAPHRVEARAKARAARLGVKDPVEVQKIVESALEAGLAPTAVQERRISARTAREWLLKLGMQFDQDAHIWHKGQ